MGFFSVRAERLADVERQVTIHPVSGEQRLVDNDRLHYIPFKFLDPANHKPGDKIDLRAGFSLDKKVIGSKRWVGEGILGQIALIKHDDDTGTSYSTAIMIPIKSAVINKADTIVVTSEVTSDPAELPHSLNDPSYVDFFKRAASKFIFEALNEPVPPNLTSKEL